MTLILSVTNILIVLVLLALASLGVGGFISVLRQERGTGLLPGTRQFGAFLAAAHAPLGSVLAGSYLPLASIGILAASTPSLRILSRSSFSPLFGHSEFCLPALNDSRMSRRFWAGVTSKRRGS